jgi:hypothetical protein
MFDCPTSQPAQKVSRIASVFVSVATVYIESKEQEARNQQPAPPIVQRDTDTGVYQQTTVYPMPAWAPIDPLLYVLGFAEDSSLNMDGAFGANANSQNWFNGNQHIMGLLEDDLSYLDTAALPF